jgi:glycolate oxidase iron-sulfur subunit
MTTCPSGVHYMHLVDHARALYRKDLQAPADGPDAAGVLARVIPYPMRFRLALLGAKIARPFAPSDARCAAEGDAGDGAKGIPPVSRNDDPQVFPAQGPRRMRVALMTGCAQKALNTDINDATIRLLRRLGCEVVVAKGAGLLRGADASHGQGGSAHAAGGAPTSAPSWPRSGGGLDAIVINTSGCGTTVKDYGHMFRTDPLAADAAVVAGLARTSARCWSSLGLPEGAPKGLRVAYHAACSLQHGQQIKTAPKDLLKRAGFEVVEPADSHLCCGSAGTYNLCSPRSRASCAPQGADAGGEARRSSPPATSAA